MAPGGGAVAAMARKGKRKDEGVWVQTEGETEGRAEMKRA